MLYNIQHHAVSLPEIIFSPHPKKKMCEPVSKGKSVIADRRRIVWLWLTGMAARDIATETGTSLSTVYRWIRRWEKEGTLATRSQYDRRIYISGYWEYDGVFANNFARPHLRTTNSSTIYEPRCSQLNCKPDNLISYFSNHNIIQKLSVPDTIKESIFRNNLF